MILALGKISYLEEYPMTGHQLYEPSCFCHDNGQSSHYRFLSKVWVVTDLTMKLGKIWIGDFNLNRLIKLAFKVSFVSEVSLQKFRRVEPTVCTLVRKLSIRKCANLANGERKKVNSCVCICVCVCVCSYVCSKNINKGVL